jgi:FMN-dependent oxidoreductase (nitrilotriacetate monooxygenase family)
MHLNVFTECAPSPQFEGLWRHPEDAGPAAYRSLAHWTALAQRLEAACIDALFFADVHGVYDAYQGSWHAAVREAVQIPSIDPVLVIPAIAAVTRQLGFAVTYSTTYHPPYLCARVFSSLDHLTEGRVAWNVVTSYLSSATVNGLGERLPHDERYDRADEYLTAVRKLWEGSWEDGAVVCDREHGVFTDPARVHEIGHVGRWFAVRGPHQCEPSPQRTPVLYQAGASARGLTFAARHAEVVFMTLGDPKRGVSQVTALRQRIADHGRDPASVKVLQGMPVIVGRTREEAQAKAELFVSLHSPEGRLVKWCGWMDIDLAAYPDDTPIDQIRIEGTRTPLDLVRRLDPNRDWVVADVRRLVTVPHRPMRGGRLMLFGTVEDVADQMERWIATAGIDGFNLVPCPPATGVDDICHLLVPELQRRGLFRTAYDPAERTLRERYFGAGNARYRGA